MINPFRSLQVIQSGLMRLLEVTTLDRAGLGLTAKIGVLEGASRALSPWEGYGRGLETTATRLRLELARAEQALARRHAERLLSNAVFSRLLFAHEFGRREESLFSKDDVLRKIDDEGMEGYLDFLVAALNQHWAPLHMWETLRGRFSEDPTDQEEQQLSSAVLIAGLLSAIESDSRVAFRFQLRWNSFSPRYPFITVRQQTDGVLQRLQCELPSKAPL